jgi:CRISPR-associated protein Cmr3
MATTTYRFIEPLDVLFLRGNKLFGDPGSHGESLVPPWPSVAAGALRSLMLAADGIDLAAFARGTVVHPTLGTPAQPGSFALTGFDLARRGKTGRVETLHALPADLSLTRDDGDGSLHLTRAHPQQPAAGLVSSAPLAQWPVLAEVKRGKPVAGQWLTQAAWGDYLAGRTPKVEQLVPAAALWQLDARIGVGLNASTRSAADGALFTAQAVAFIQDVGFLAAVSGAVPPGDGILRFGGDGRGASLSVVDYAPPQPDWEAISRARRCRIVLSTPGLFAQGWLLPGVDAEHLLSLHGISGRLVCAAVPRAEVVSGWDLARAHPKAAERLAPTGSVYWIDQLQATAGQLRKLAEHGLWSDEEQNATRRAEGFNRFAFAAW